MKKFLFLALAASQILAVTFLSAAESKSANTREDFFKYAQAQLSVSQTLQKEDDKNQISADAGAKILFSFADLRFFDSLPKSDWSKIKEAAQGDFPEDLKDLLEKPRWGGGIFLFKESFPIEAKGGHISFSKSVAKLNSPAPSILTGPLTKSFSFSTGLGAGLPTLSSSEKPRAFSLSAGKEFSRFSFFAQGAADEDKKILASCGLTFKITRFTKISSTFTGGRFYIESSSKVLESNYCKIEPGWQKAFVWENLFSSPWLKASVAAGLQEVTFSPEYERFYEDKAIWIRGKSRSTFRNFLLDSSFFFVPTAKKFPKAAPLVTASSSLMRTYAQASLNPQVLFLFDGGRSLRVGLAGGTSRKSVGTKKIAMIQLAEGKAAFEFEGRVFNFGAEGGIKNRVLRQEECNQSDLPDFCYTGGLDFGAAFQKGRISSTASLKHYPEYGKDEKIRDEISFSVNAAPGKSRILSLSGGWKGVFTDRERDSASVNAGAKVNIQMKKFRLSAKYTVTIKI